MSSITGACSRLMRELVHALRGGYILSASAAHIDPIKPAGYKSEARDHELMLRALTAVFGMDQSNGRINKKKARQVVEKLGLVGHDEQLTTSFDLAAGLEEEVPLEEVLRMEEEDGSTRNELLRQAFKIFDEDGNGFIDALELKRVLQCLGLDNGWDMAQVEKMLKVVDLNLDGKVDFTEFELMMNEAADGLH
ncbi:putative calcium-binding protein CML43 [Hibiscus syriacus]|uniref:Calcium-binding protein CML43 n=1 Tax=Hibiscus syriacus TaxID=106335 RepID=A0A6A2Y7A1_HIBSY|nr:calmodulin-like protein 6 [Hibiscus syriacus]KAE8665244.1 putative calcium-binding protein CML43 [Hibiscus syriacus]